MYKITKDIKQFSTILILIGLISLSYGFFQSFSVTSDDEIKATVKKIAKDLKLDYEDKKYKDVGYLIDDNDQVIEQTSDTFIDGEIEYKKEKKEIIDYAALIYKV